MKKSTKKKTTITMLIVLLVALLLLLGKCHRSLRNELGAIKEQERALTVRLAALEAQQQPEHRYITDVSSFTDDGAGGWMISFSSGEPNPIFIYNGRNGKNGMNGMNGMDGATPQIGVAQYPNNSGAYYWTLNGAWLLDDDGKRIPTTGPQGAPGMPAIAAIAAIPEIVVDADSSAQPWQPLQTPRQAGWQVGAYAGLPYFWGDFTSLAADKTYTGYLFGLQVGYRFNNLFGLSLTLDYAANRAGAHSYALDYRLAADGMTYYLPQSFDTKKYGDLYARIAMFAAGLHADINANRIFGQTAANARLKLIISPAVYLQHFNSAIYTKADDTRFTNVRLNKSVSFALGGDVALRYDLTPTFGLQLKGTASWITDNYFDNIATVEHAQYNALWGVSAGMVWKFNE